MTGQILDFLQHAVAYLKKQLHYMIYHIGYKPVIHVI